VELKATPRRDGVGVHTKVARTNPLLRPANRLEVRQRFGTKRTRDGVLRSSRECLPGVSLAERVRAHAKGGR
jgi:hypothetical protein